MTTRVRHIETGTTGTIQDGGASAWIRWEQGPLADSPVGRVWPVSPGEIEILGEEP